MSRDDLDRDARVTSITERRDQVLVEVQQARLDKAAADKHLERLIQQENELWRELHVAQKAIS